jgi:hypothetical protein
MIGQSVVEILDQHVKLSIEGIDRMYLNIYVARLQTEQGSSGSSAIIAVSRCYRRPR